MSEQNVKILIVEDDPFVKNLLVDILQSENYDTQSAENGMVALEKYYSDETIKLIVSDMNMPELNGLGLIKELRNKKKDVPIIILTSNDDISTAIDALKSGADDYIIKDKTIQDAIVISAKNVLEKQQMKELNLKLMAELKEKNRRIEYELNVAHEMQLSIVPDKKRMEYFLQTSLLNISSVFRPCNKLGGDFWDMIELTEDKTGIIVVDFSGHGIVPSLSTFRIKEYIHSLGNEIRSPAKLLEMMNKNIFKNFNINATCSYAIFDKRDKRLTYSRAGHPYGIWYKKSEDKLIELKSKGMTLGFLPDSKYEEKEIVLGKGDKLIFYTDGIIEAQNINDEFFGDDRLKKIIFQKKDTSPAALSNAIMAFFENFIGEKELNDDITQVVLEPVENIRRKLK